ncbi:class I SAM-dependent methyltransferase [Gammaproteobacteria bacterium]|jgi:predicted O-methyltransferase YrrM|nr:class I SAM-dependent methyltransferase [Gammaproteobacteria bacterium]
MDFDQLNNIKGFMPSHEGLALTKWAEKFAPYGPALEIGTFGAKSALYIAAGSAIHNQLVYTVDHHSGSEEHQLGEEYFDAEIYDEKLGRVNTVPLMQSNLQQFEERKWVVPILANANSIASSWGTELGLLFIDGSHTEVSAMNDYDNWSSKLHSQGALVIHDIYEKPEDGGQAPYLVYQKAQKEGFKLFERVDTIVCLTKA